jgi:hypothetical protein
MPESEDGFRSGIFWSNLAAGSSLFRGQNTLKRLSKYRGPFLFSLQESELRFERIYKLVSPRSWFPSGASFLSLEVIPTQRAIWR